MGGGSGRVGGGSGRVGGLGGGAAGEGEGRTGGEHLCNDEGAAPAIVCAACALSLPPRISRAVTDGWAFRELQLRFCRREGVQLKSAAILRRAVPPRN